MMISIHKGRTRRQKASARFDLRIERDGQEFRASVIDARVSDAETRFKAPFTGEELARYRYAVENLARDPDRAAADMSEDNPERNLERAGADVSEVPGQLGTRLFRKVFSGGVLKAWRDAVGRASGKNCYVSLRLHLRDPELERWPWESLRDPDENTYLGLSASTPILRHPTEPLPIRPLRIKLPVRILGVVTRPRGCTPLEGEREWNLLRQSLSPLVEEGLVQLDRLEPPTLPGLRRELANGGYQILHFIGHGKFDGKKDQGYLCFEGESGRLREVGAEELGTLLQDKKLRLVVLNACYGARGSSSDPFAGVAANLIRRKVAAVVAMQFKVADELAVLFAQLLYGKLATGLPIDLAMAEVRIDMRDRGFAVEWRNPVLYMRSSVGRIFKLEGEPSEGGQKGGGERQAVPGTPGAQVIVTGGLTSPRTSAWKAAAAVLGIIASLAIPIIGQSGAAERSPECPYIADLDLKLRLIESGSIVVGNRVITIDKPYCIGVYELTRAQQAKIMGANPITGPAGDLPATGISRNAADVILGKLDKRLPKARFRLPTGDQWEYAARAGGTGEFHFGSNPELLPEYGNCRGVNPEGGPMPVGSYKANEFGLFDFYGNVSEWTSDTKLDNDGQTKWIRRGGSWDVDQKNCSSSREFPSISRKTDYDEFGMRVVSDPI